MALSNKDLIDCFNQGENKGVSSSMFIAADVLYSYGYHFPLMVKGRNFQILNADTYSVTTSAQQSACFSIADLVIPFSALVNVLTNVYSLSNIRVKEAIDRISIIDKRRIRYDLLYYKNPETKDILSIREYQDMTDIDKRAHYEPSEERRPESALLKINIPEKQFPYSDNLTTKVEKARIAYYLSSMDDDQYFLVELPKPCETVSDAFEMLKPNCCKNKAEDIDYKRQGEWFFVDITQYLHFDNKSMMARKRQYDTLTSDFILPRADKDSHPHTATRGGFLSDFALLGKPDIKGLNASTPVVSGQIRHPEHNMAKLSTLKDIRFYAAFENKAVSSWSAVGNVD